MTGSVPAASHQARPAASPRPLDRAAQTPL